MNQKWLQLEEGKHSTAEKYMSHCSDDDQKIRFSLNVFIGALVWFVWNIFDERIIASLLVWFSEQATRVYDFYKYMKEYV